MFRTTTIRLWLQTVVLTAGLIFLLVRFGPFGLFRPPAAGLAPPPSEVLSPTLALALGCAGGAVMATFAGFFLVLDFLQFLLLRAARRAGQPAHPGHFRRSLLLHSQLLTLGLSAGLWLLLLLGQLLRQLPDGALSPAALRETLLLQTAFAGLLLLALAPASLLVWLLNAPRLRAEWNAGPAQ